MHAQKRLGAFDLLLYGCLSLLLVVTVVPFWQLVVTAFSTSEAYIKDPIHLVPSSFSLKVFGQLFASSDIIKGMGVSIVNVSCGWLGGLLLASLGAYALNKKYIYGRKIFFGIIIFTMFFSGGIIPLYVLVRQLHMTDTIWCLFIPSLINTFYLFLLKNSFAAVPAEMEEAALIDGYNELQILFKIMLPLAKSTIAAVSLFLVVQYWNDYYYAMLFMNRSDLYPLGLLLRNVIILKRMLLNTPVSIGASVITSDQYNAAMTLVAMVPIGLMYPFAQKYFVAGIMIGAVKE